MSLVHPGRSQPSYTPTDRGVEQWEEVRFTSPDDLQLAGWFIPPDPHGDGATLIFVHGLGNNRGELLDEAVMMASHGYGAPSLFKRAILMARCCSTCATTARARARSPRWDTPRRRTCRARSTICWPGRT